MSTLVCPGCGSADLSGESRCARCAAPLPHLVGWLRCDPLPAVPLGLAPEVTVGRAPSCDLVLQHAAVSRVHAVLHVEGTSIRVEDRSSFGCFVNGEKIEGPTPLEPSDRLTIGPYSLSVTRLAAVPDEGVSEVTRPMQAPADPLRPGMIMAGRLEQVPALELLQGFEFNRKTATLRLEAEGLEAELVVVDGRPVRARFGEVEGLEAAVQIASLASGQFTVFAAAEGPATFGASMTEVLLEASRRQDEQRRG